MKAVDHVGPASGSRWGGGGFVLAHNRFLAADGEPRIRVTGQRAPDNRREPEQPELSKRPAADEEGRCRYCGPGSPTGS